MVKQLCCWKCGGQMSVEPRAAGAQVKCPHCSTAVPVPADLFGTSPAAPITDPYNRGVRRPGTGKSPFAAALLNFFFWGGGYVYLKRAWGWLILVPYLLINVGTCVAIIENPEAAEEDDALGLLLGLLICGAFAWHASRMASRDARVAEETAALSESGYR